MYPNRCQILFSPTFHSPRRPLVRALLGGGYLNYLGSPVPDVSRFAHAGDNFVMPSLYTLVYLGDLLLSVSSPVTSMLCVTSVLQLEDL